jgi:hypothetical protein
MNLREIGWEGVDWMHLAEDRDEWGGGGGTLKYGNETWSSLKGV